MPYDDKIAERVRAALRDQKDIREIKMFGGLAFMINGNMCCGVERDRLMLRLGNDGAVEALREKYTSPMDFTGRPLKSMIYVEKKGFSTTSDLERWIGKAVRFCVSLPPGKKRGES